MKMVIEKKIYISEQDREWLEKVFSVGAECVEEFPEHWIAGGDDSGLSYCFVCAEKEVARLSKKYQTEEFVVDGGWGDYIGDSQAFCEDCGKLLDNDFTQYACEMEVDHFLEDGFDFECGDDCLSMSKVISSAGWEPISHNDLNFYNNLHELCNRILADINKTL